MIPSFLTGFSCGVGGIAVVLVAVHIASSIRKCGEGD